MEIKKVNLKSKLDAINEYWSPHSVGALNNQLVKIAKFKGDFISHFHENEDESFYVIEGQLFTELEEETITLNTGEFVVIPKGVVYKPYEPEEVSVMLFEPNSTLNTGNITNEMTKTDLDEI